jgi:GT2 family glycosyltransferase
MEELNIILLNWNGNADTFECIQSIRENDYQNYLIILVDNGSKYDNYKKLEEWCKKTFQVVVIYKKEEAENGGIPEKENILSTTPSQNKIVIIKNENNLGFAAGNNVAVRYCFKKKSEYVMLLNNDTVVETDSLSKLMNFFILNTEYVAVTPQIRYYEPNDIIWNCGGKIILNIYRKYYYFHQNSKSLKLDKPFQITFITGCALLFRPSQCGLLSEKFFFGEEDFEFSIRLKKNKQKIACLPSSVIYHKIGSSIKTEPQSINRAFLHHLNRLIDFKEENYFFWLIILIPYILAITIKLSSNKKFKFHKLKFMYLMFLYSLKFTNIDREKFERIMSYKF